MWVLSGFDVAYCATKKEQARVITPQHTQRTLCTSRQPNGLLCAGSSMGASRCGSRIQIRKALRSLLGAQICFNHRIHPFTIHLFGQEGPVSSGVSGI